MLILLIITVFLQLVTSARKYKIHLFIYIYIYFFFKGYICWVVTKDFSQTQDYIDIRNYNLLTVLGLTD